MPCLIMLKLQSEKGLVLPEVGTQVYNIQGSSVLSLGGMKRRDQGWKSDVSSGVQTLTA